MRITFELESADIEHFQGAFDRARRLACDADEVDIVDAAKQALDSLCIATIPGYVRKRLVHVQRLILMLEDEDWSLRGPERIDALAALAYFGDPDDLIPDHIEVIGLIDDAIMLELLARRMRHVLQRLPEVLHDPQLHAGARRRRWSRERHGRACSPEHRAALMDSCLRGASASTRMSIHRCELAMPIARIPAQIGVKLASFPDRTQSRRSQSCK